MTVGLAILMVFALGFVFLIVGSLAWLQVSRAKQQRLMFEAAIAAGQADVARDLLRPNWLQTVLRALAVVVVVFVLVVMVAGASWMALSRSGPGTAESAAFRQTVERVIGAPVGTVEVTIDGHKAHGILTGNVWGMQSCGSPYQSQLRFSTITPGPLNVYYIPDLDQYYVFGKARVTPAGKVVENGLISTAEALGGVANTPTK
jgi:hypothetical protein